MCLLHGKDGLDTEYKFVVLKMLGLYPDTHKIGYTFAVC